MPWGIDCGLIWLGQLIDALIIIILSTIVSPELRYVGLLGHPGLASSILGAGHLVGIDGGCLGVGVDLRSRTEKLMYWSLGHVTIAIDWHRVRRALTGLPSVHWPFRLVCATFCMLVSMIRLNVRSRELPFMRVSFLFLAGSALISKPGLSICDWAWKHICQKCERSLIFVLDFFLLSWRQGID